MPRLIEVQEPPPDAAPLVVQPGDVLQFYASGLRLRSGGAAVEVIGPLLTAVVGTNGAVIEPAGSPNIVLLHARAPGRATVDVIGGDPWHGSQSTTVEVVVEP